MQLGGRVAFATCCASFGVEAEWSNLVRQARGTVVKLTAEEWDVGYPDPTLVARSTRVVWVAASSR